MPPGPAGPSAALRKRRCLIPASGFFEWRREGKAKQPFAFRLADDKPFAFVGIWEAWRPESGPPLLTCAILTTTANERVRPVHNRMPIILDPRHYDSWIDRNVQEPAELADALACRMSAQTSRKHRAPARLLTGGRRAAPFSSTLDGTNHANLSHVHHGRRRPGPHAVPVALGAGA